MLISAVFYLHISVACCAEPEQIVIRAVCWQDQVYAGYLVKETLCTIVSL